MSRWLAGLSLVLVLQPAAAIEPDRAATGKQKPFTKPVVKPIALNPKGTVLLDRGGKRLLLKARVCARDRVLEMLCCLKRTKEHESILTLDASAAVVHAGLLALGARQGTPVRHYKEVAPGKVVPDFKPPTGQRIEIFLQWKDKAGKPRRVRAQRWIRRATQRYFSAPLAKLPEGVVLSEKRPKLVFDEKNRELVWFGPMKPAQRDGFLKLSGDKVFVAAVRRLFAESQPTQMKAYWVFAGSGFVADMKTGKKIYLAENGNLVCVANFPSATLDIAQASSDKGSSLLYEAYTERIPPVDTEVLIELIPKSEPVGKTSPPPPPTPRVLPR
jgi:hypothetical protein